MEPNARPTPVPLRASPLAAGNPRGITTDGTHLWVVDTGTDDVYKYTVGGTLVGSWALDSRNTVPRGITIGPGKRRRRLGHRQHRRCGLPVHRRGRAHLRQPVCRTSCSASPPGTATRKALRTLRLLAHPTPAMPNRPWCSVVAASPASCKARTGDLRHCDAIQPRHRTPSSMSRSAPSSFCNSILLPRLRPHKNLGAVTKSLQRCKRQIKNSWTTNC